MSLFFCFSKIFLRTSNQTANILWKSHESFPTFILKTLMEVQPVHPKGDQSWVFIGRTDVEAETPILWPPDAKSWKRPWCWERLRAGGEGDNGGWDGWMASPTWWTWVWVNSRSWWWIPRPSVLWFMGSQRVGHDRATELNWWNLILIPLKRH